MGLRHIVLLSFEGATDEQRQAVVDGLRALPGTVESIRGYVVSTDAGINEGNHDLAVIADFDDEDGYVAYRDDPAHQAVIREHIRPILTGRAAIQFRT
jgi:hypothetical protein